MAIDAKKLLDQFLNSGIATGMAAGIVGSAIAKRTGIGGLARIGGLALVGTLAYQAWQRHKQQQSGLPAEDQSRGIGNTLKGVLSGLPGVEDLLQSQPQASASGFGVQSNTASQNQLGTAVLTAMIAAAKADGEVDRVESQKILGQMDQAGLSGEEKSYLLAELARPLDVGDVVKLSTSPEVAAQIYTASLLITDQANDREAAYLSTLAEKLNLPHEFISQIHRELKN